MRENTSLRRLAIRIHQDDAHPLYLFALTGEEIIRLADISRVSRDDAGRLIGYQRPEVRKHVEDIVEYLNSDNVLFPNSIIIALSSRVRFVASRGPQIGNGFVSTGTIEIPIPDQDGPKPGWIVDGQQRTLALLKSKRSDVLVPVNAFVADEVDLQRDQFLRINNTRPLPRGLITELLPEVAFPLPARLAARKVPSALCDVLNQHPDSPFHGLIRRASTAREARGMAVVADTSVVAMLAESLASPSGCLFPYRNLATGETDTDTILRLVFAYWAGVKRTFPQAWGKPAHESRLMHGVGIRAMGRLMDKVISPLEPRSSNLEKAIARELRVVQPLCRWTDGSWEDLGGLPWDELQNVPRHIRLLSNYLIREYVQRRGTGR